MRNDTAIELTVFTKADGLLTKRIALTADGKIVSDGSACRMARGTAQRMKVAGVGQLAELIENIRSDQALALGALRADLPDQVEIVAKADLNGVAQPTTIARLAANISYRPGQTAFVLLDSDSKGMPPDIAAEVNRRGGFWPTLLTLFPALHGIACVTRTSTSAGLFRSDTGDRLPGSGGMHSYLAVQDGADAERFLKVLHDWCWLAGFGWMMVGVGGQLLQRSLIDRLVFGAERLVFEGPPILKPPLQQDSDSRRPVAIEGDVLDTVTAFAPLTIADKAKLDELKAAWAYRLETEVAKARDAFIKTQAARIIKRTGISKRAAERVAVKHCSGVLLPTVELPFDDPALAGRTVGEVLADPERFEGATLADPLEGIGYGIGKAKVLLKPDGTPWIHSFAHGRTVYQLKCDAAAVRAAMDAADADEVVTVFVERAAAAELDDDELDELQDEAVRRSGVKKTKIGAMLKKARQTRADQHIKQERNRRTAQRKDPRPAIAVPANDSPWLPVMGILNDVLGRSRAAKPPIRDVDGFVTRARKQPIPRSHAFTNATSNATQEDEADKLPVPEQWLLARMNDIELSEMIEAHIDFVGKDRSVQLPMAFVRHYQQRHDDVLPTVVAIATAPIVLADGAVLAPEGLDRLRGIIFEIPKEVREILPRCEDCTDDAVGKAMRFLCDDWLCDVSAGFVGKAIIIAAALTLIERSLLPDRPAFFVRAGRRGGGKTTLIVMLIMAVMGVRPAALAWSTNEEERRKALLSQLLSGVGYFLWDNIERGTQVYCPHIERSCTTAFYSDRKLGFSEMIATAAAAIHIFTGNNIAPRGDLASRSLTAELTVDRPDPENREFKHPDPVGWTEDNRGKILHALFTILLGNPQLKQPRDAPARTRFKMWWRLIGSAVEHAAKLHDGKEDALDFQKLFIEQEETDDEDSISLADALEAVLEQFESAPNGSFTAAELAEVINKPETFGLFSGTTLRDFLYPDVPAGFGKISAESVSSRLRKHLDNPVKSGQRILSLHKTKNSGAKNTLAYYVKTKNEP
jgi:hypothetical protein